MTTDRTDSGPPRRRKLPTRFLGAAVVLAATLAIAYYSLCYSASESMGGFGEGTARSPQYTTHYGEATRALEAWLRTRGFEETPVLNARGANRSGAVYERWFSGTHQGSGRFIVTLNLGSAEKAGVGAGTVWEWRGLKWGMSEDRERVRGFSQLLEHWWSDYTRDHPHP